MSKGSGNTRRSSASTVVRAINGGGAKLTLSSSDRQEYINSNLNVNEALDGIKRNQEFNVGDVTVEVFYGDEDDYGYVSTSYGFSDNQGHSMEWEGSDFLGYDYNGMLKEALANLNQFLFDYPQKVKNR